MDPDIKKLIEELAPLAAQDQFDTPIADHPATRAAAILQAIFDPENQPSQFGTVLLETKKPAPAREGQGGC